MTRPATATQLVDGHREPGEAGRGDPVPRQARDLELVETAGWLRRPAPRHDRSKWGITLCALASVLAIVVAYYFAFGAAHAAQIRDVPLATKGGRP